MSFRYSLTTTTIPLRCWEQVPSTIISLMMTYLPLESFACDHTNVALVCRLWKNSSAKCRAHLRLTDANIHFIGRLCRIPLVAHIDADHLDETLTHALRYVKHLRSLTWHIPNAPAFDMLPTIISNNPQLITINGSLQYFIEHPIPGRGGGEEEDDDDEIMRIGQSHIARIARSCERLLVDRPEASINGIPIKFCDCGNHRIFTQCCMFRSKPLTITNASDISSLRDDITTLTDIQRDQHSGSISDKSFSRELMQLATRFLYRMSELDSLLELKNNTIQLQMRQLNESKLAIKNLKTDIIELCGQVAERQMIIDEFKIK